jgi:prephenate dehydratase
MKIGVAGAIGSFSYIVGERYIEERSLKNAEIVPLVSVENVLSSLDKNEVDCGIFPIENSNGGIVIEAVHAMAAHTFDIEKMIEFDVHHNLLIRPETNASQITAITSHDQALKQCRQYLKRRWEDISLEEYTDTAVAAKDLGEGKLPETTAVIAPKRCAELYGLKILEESIQDLKYNYTTFVIGIK